MVAYIGELEYTMIESAFADADDIEDAEFKMLEAFKEDFPDAINVKISNIEEVGKTSGS